MRRYLTFFLVSAGLAIAPGPDILFVLAQSLAQGASAGCYVTLGLCSGLVVHVSLAAFGFAAVVRRCPRFFTVITWLGAAYLLYLAVGAWRSASVVVLNAPSADLLPPLRLYLRGIVMNLCNPKVILFFLALMPRFVVQERGKVALQFVLLGVTFALAALMVFNAVALGGGAVSKALVNDPGATSVLQRFSSLVMFGLAAWIVWKNRRAAV